MGDPLRRWARSDRSSIKDSRWGRGATRAGGVPEVGGRRSEDGRQKTEDADKKRRGKEILAQRRGGAEKIRREELVRATRGRLEAA
jgi:hypothetical protein